MPNKKKLGWRQGRKNVMLKHGRPNANLSAGMATVVLGVIGHIL